MSFFRKIKLYQIWWVYNVLFVQTLICSEHNIIFMIIANVELEWREALLSDENDIEMEKNKRKEKEILYDIYCSFISYVQVCDNVT